MAQYYILQGPFIKHIPSSILFSLCRLISRRAGVSGCEDCLMKPLDISLQTMRAGLGYLGLLRYHFSRYTSLLEF